MVGLRLIAVAALCCHKAVQTKPFLYMPLHGGGMLAIDDLELTSSVLESHDKLAFFHVYSCVIRSSYV